MSAPILVTDFSFWYGKRQALDQISLNVRPGTIAALIGPSGSGKTTLLRSVNRLHSPFLRTTVAGEIRVGDVSVYSRSTDAATLRRTVGMVFQRPNPLPGTIFDNVAYGPRLHGKEGEELDVLVEATLRRCVLWDETRDRLRASAHALSLGQQQRLCIARALANSPEALLLDEPTSALDPIATQAIEQLLYDLRDALTIILVTHDLRQAARVSDITAFLDGGRVVEAGPTDVLFTSPAERKTESYLTRRFG